MLSPLIECLGPYCEAELARHACPSVSVAVASRGEVVFAEAYGDAGVTTAYALASVTKPMTATAVCLPTDDARAAGPLLGVDLRRTAGDATGSPEGLAGVARAYQDGDAEGLLDNMLPHVCTFRPR